MEAFILDRIGKRADGYLDPPSNQPLPALAGPFRPPHRRVQNTFNRLKSRAISGKIATPSETGACDMRSTGTGSDKAFVHADPHFCPCAVLPSDDDVPHRVDRGQFMIAAVRSAAPTSLVSRKTSDYPPLSHSRSRASSIVHRRENSGSHSSPQPNGL